MVYRSVFGCIFYVHCVPSCKEQWRQAMKGKRVKRATRNILYPQVLTEAGSLRHIAAEVHRIRWPPFCGEVKGNENQLRGREREREHTLWVNLTLSLWLCVRTPLIFCVPNENLLDTLAAAALVWPLDDLPLALWLSLSVLNSLLLSFSVLMFLDFLIDCSGKNRACSPSRPTVSHIDKL